MLFHLSRTHKSGGVTVPLQWAYFLQTIIIREEESELFCDFVTRVDEFDFSQVDAIAPRYACVQGLGRGAPAWLGQRMTLEISSCFCSPSYCKSMEPPGVHKDAFQYLVETVRKAEESGETEQARSLHFPFEKAMS